MLVTFAALEHYLLHKIPINFQMWKFCRNAEFSLVFGNLPENLWKLCVSTNFQEKKSDTFI